MNRPSRLFLASLVSLIPSLAWATETAQKTFEQQVDKWFGDYLVTPVATIFFMKVGNLVETVSQMPLIVAWLGFFAIFFTLRMRLVNVRMFRHAIDLVRGKFDDPKAKGEVSHFQALATALSATVGLGNIAGVAIAIMIGGPGATFWIIVVGLLGMSMKFVEVTLGQHYRQVRGDGTIMGGAMYYLSDGLAAQGKAGLGKFLASAFVILCVLASFGGGNSFQVKQGLDQVRTVVPFLDTYPWVYGIVMVVLVGIVIIGGIRRIARVADKVVPIMCGVYVLACLIILGMHFTAIPTAFGTIIDGAFNPGAAYGGFAGCLVIGIQRAVFSNEAGVGSAAIAHSAAKVEYPVQEGIVSLLEPFIDTVIVCTMTGLVIVITGAYDPIANPDYASMITGREGAALTSAAMGSQISWFPYVLAVAVIAFSYSTMISWSYYGERCWTWLFGETYTMVYRILFLVFTFLGSVVSATNILDFSDLMLLGMAFPNLLGIIFMAGLVSKLLKDYEGKLARGEILTTQERLASAQAEAEAVEAPATPTDEAPEAESTGPDDEE